MLQLARHGVCCCSRSRSCVSARRDQAGRDHVVILETSAWMGARSGNRTLMDLARERARALRARLALRATA